MNKKISELDLLASPASTDILPITDLDAVGGPATKKVTVSNLVASAPQGDLIAANNLSDVASAATARTNLGIDTSGFKSAFQTTEEITASRSLSDTDNGKVLACNDTSLVTITIPSGLTSGFSCKLVQKGSGLIKIVAGSGAVLNAVGGKSFTQYPYQAVEILNYASELYTLEGSDLQTDPLAWTGNTTSLTFDGVADYLSITSTTINTGQTISAWVKFSDTASYTRPILSSGTQRLAWNPGNGYAYWGSGSNVEYVKLGVANSTDWYHVVVTQSVSNDIKFFLDGQQQTLQQTTGGTGVGNFTFDSIGKYGNEYFKGKIDELAIWTSDQTANILNMTDASGNAANLSSLNPKPEHWWRMGDFEGGTGGVVNDQGNNAALTAVINGATFDITDAP